MFADTEVEAPNMQGEVDSLVSVQSKAPAALFLEGLPGQGQGEFWTQISALPLTGLRALGQTLDTPYL